MEDILDLGGGIGRGQDPAMAARGDSAGGTATIGGDTANPEAQEAAPKKKKLGVAHGQIGRVRG